MPAPADEAGTGDRSRPSLMRQRDFLLLWSGASVSLLGTAVTNITVPIIALGMLHASAFQISALAAAGQLPALLFALPAGALVDRCRKRQLMVWCDAIRAAALGSVPFAAWTGLLSLGQLYTVEFVTATAAVIFDAASQSFTPRVVAPDQLMDANSRMAASSAFARSAGTGVAGLLVGVLGAARTVVVDALSYAANVTVLLLIRTPESVPPRAPSRVSMRGEVAEGLRFVLAQPLIRPVMLCNANDSFFLGFINALWLAYVTRELGWSVEAAGLVLGLATGGGVLGGLVTRRLVGRLGLSRVLILSEAVVMPCSMATPFAPPGLAGQLTVFCALSTVLTTTVVYNVAQLTLLQTLCPPELLGRTNSSIRWLQWGLMPLGALSAGALSTWIGVRHALILGAAGLVGGVLTLANSPVRKMRSPSQCVGPAQIPS